MLKTRTLYCWNRQMGWIDYSSQMAFNAANLAKIAAAIGAEDEAIKLRDKFAEMKLTPVAVDGVSVPAIGESPVNLACQVTDIIPLGSHDLFLAKIVSVTVDERYLDEKGTFHLNQAGLVAYSHGEYFALGKKLGSFGYSVRKKPANQKKKRSNTKQKRK